MKQPLCDIQKSFWNEGKTDIAVVLGLLCLSGNPVFSAGLLREAILVAALLALSLLMIHRRVPLTKGFFVIPVIFLAILVYQCVLFQVFPLTTLAGFFIRLALAYLAVRVVRDFPGTFIGVSSVLAGIFLFFWMADNLLAVAGIPFKNLFGSLPGILGGERYEHILFYNFNYSKDSLPFRNAGMFWEPGALAGYTLVALILLGLKRQNYPPKRYWLQFTLLALCLLSTLSTMGYLLLLPAMLLHLRRPQANCPGVPASAGLLLLIPVFLLIWNADFVARKISVQFDRAATRGRGWEINRIGNFMFDLEYIQARPLLGWGLHQETRYMMHPGSEFYKGQGNGLSDFTAKFGLLGMGLFALTTWIGMTRIAGGNPLAGGLALCLVLLSLNGETFLNHSFFLSLMFLEEIQGSPRPTVQPGKKRMLESLPWRPESTIIGNM